jgi:hypothetical protein
MSLAPANLPVSAMPIEAAARVAICRRFRPGLFGRLQDKRSMEKD